MYFFGKYKIIGNVLKYFAHECKASFHFGCGFHVDEAVLVRWYENWIDEAKKYDCAYGLKSGLKKALWDNGM